MAINLEKDDLIKALSKNKEARDNLKAYRSLISNENTWHGIMATPPNSVLDVTIKAFFNESSIPLELPFFSIIHHLSGFLLKKGITIKFAGGIIKPDIWSIVLASSGGGKTFTSSLISKAIEERDSFPDPASSAKFIEDLKFKNNSIWIRDEFAQFLKAIETQAHMMEIKDYLLRVYDGNKIERRTKKQVIEINDPALTIVGTTVLETFAKNVTPEMMLDGFAQRFSFIIARSDPARPDHEHPIFEVAKHSKKIKTSWDKTISAIKHDQYTVSKDAEESFKESFKTMFSDNSDLPSSFFRRVMFRAVKYALIYHIILKKRTKTIDSDDMVWATRVCYMHLKDGAELVGNYNIPDLEKTLVRAEEIRDELLAKGQVIKPRDLIRRMNIIKNVSQANAILSVIS
jgi:hypothetical protein